jgi:hypothetical protein
MKSTNIEKLDDNQFRRITGVRRSTFEKMLEILGVAESCRRAKGGPKPTLSLNEMLLATLEYLREYRTYAHIAVGYGVSESQMFRIIKWVEDTLVKDKTFALPGRKALLKSDMDYEVVLIDATETPVERPKKSRSSGTQVKRNVTP